MARAKLVYVSEVAHRRLKVLAARRGRPMGKLVEELIEREADDLANPWLSPQGLALQGKALSGAWDDPALDVYGDA